MITEIVRKYIDESILCWLATADENNFPNVSPKEIFTYIDDKIIVANIASPNTIENIIFNKNVCISFVEVFKQKGFKIKGTARIIDKENELFIQYWNQLNNKFSIEVFPLKSIIEIEPKEVLEIKAPSYFLNPNISEQTQIENALHTYKVNKSEDSKIKP